ncbi:MAG: hypothetical protein IPK03_09960 [Bacteroidetes bacterium]|nr:hypothetical protein [Bacteroidota bacterium]
MIILEMDERHTLKVHKDTGKARLTLTADGIDLACKKESKKRLLEYLKPIEAHLFKGRLQLIISMQDVFIQYKENIKGRVNKADLIQAIESL